MTATWLALVNGNSEPLNGFAVDGLADDAALTVGRQVEVYGEDGIFTVQGFDGTRLTLDRPVLRTLPNNAAIYELGGKP